MWQTKYASAVPKNLGVGVDFWLCSEGDFVTGRPYSVAKMQERVWKREISCLYFEMTKTVYTMRKLILLSEKLASQQ